LFETGIVPNIVIMGTTS